MFSAKVGKYRYLLKYHQLSFPHSILRSSNKKAIDKRVESEGAVRTNTTLRAGLLEDGMRAVRNAKSHIYRVDLRIYLFTSSPSITFPPYPSISSTRSLIRTPDLLPSATMQHDISEASNSPLEDFLGSCGMGGDAEWGGREVDGVRQGSSVCGIELGRLWRSGRGMGGREGAREGARAGERKDSVVCL